MAIRRRVTGPRCASVRFARGGEEVAARPDPLSGVTLVTVRPPRGCVKGHSRSAGSHPAVDTGRVPVQTRRRWITCGVILGIVAVDVAHPLVDEPGPSRVVAESRLGGIDRLDPGVPREPADGPEGARLVQGDQGDGAGDLVGSHRQLDRVGETALQHPRTAARGDAGGVRRRRPVHPLGLAVHDLLERVGGWAGHERHGSVLLGHVEVVDQALVEGRLQRLHVRHHRAPPELPDVRRQELPVEHHVEPRHLPNPVGDLGGPHHRCSGLPSGQLAASNEDVHGRPLSSGVTTRAAAALGRLSAQDGEPSTGTRSAGRFFEEAAQVPVRSMSTPSTALGCRSIQTRA